MFLLRLGAERRLLCLGSVYLSLSPRNPPPPPPPRPRRVALGKQEHGRFARFRAPAPETEWKKRMGKEGGPKMRSASAMLWCLLCLRLVQSCYFLLRPSSHGWCECIVHEPNRCQYAELTGPFFPLVRLFSSSGPAGTVECAAGACTIRTATLPMAGRQVDMLAEPGMRAVHVQTPSPPRPTCKCAPARTQVQTPQTLFDWPDT